ncbi:unnamed protein product [Ilex paraguariensis]|uniref:Uncharacterized protein n=1 Tax=Ilex paraguariensis TaxID=185542 RepID=A0ABC8SRL6_9AQUA
MGAKMKTGLQKENKFIQFVKGPIRILAKARDLYTKSMYDCAGRINQGSVVVCTAPIMPEMLRNSSANSSAEFNNEDLRELIRVLSTRRGGGGKVEEGDLEQLEWRQPVVVEGGGGVMGRSYSVGVGKIGRIDEEKPCDFVEVDIYPRRKSYAKRMLHITEGVD